MDILAVKQRFGIIGNSELLNRALGVALRVAPTDLSILITGESGSGKEFFPQVIHTASSRKHNKYIAVNCGAIPEGTIDSELFGHEKGAFTGAVESRKGYFEEATDGTIFLDEVAELPLSTQVRLLRVLQTGEYMRVGSAKVQKCNVRVVAATNVDLPAAIQQGRFREDLYYRLNTVPIVIPPLRERREDIYMLFRKFASEIASKYNMPPITLEAGARELLEGYYWRGNIRQLKSVAEQISAIEPTRTITAEIVQRYLPDQTAVGVVTTNSDYARNNEDTTFNSEREILYKVLFDMRGDIAELKRMVEQLRHPQQGDMGMMTGEPLVGLIQPTLGLPVSREEYGAGEIVEEPLRELTKEDVQREQIEAALRRSGGRRKEAAAELFISERTLYRKIKELGIE